MPWPLSISLPKLPCSPWPCSLQVGSLEAAAREGVSALLGAFHTEPAAAAGPEDYVAAFNGVLGILAEGIRCGGLARFCEHVPRPSVCFCLCGGASLAAGSGCGICWARIGASLGWCSPCCPQPTVFPPFAPAGPPRTRRPAHGSGRRPSSAHPRCAAGAPPAPAPTCWSPWLPCALARTNSPQVQRF